MANRCPHVVQQLSRIAPFPVVSPKLPNVVQKSSKCCPIVVQHSSNICPWGNLDTLHVLGLAACAFAGPTVLWFGCMCFGTAACAYVCPHAIIFGRRCFSAIPNLVRRCFCSMWFGMAGWVCMCVCLARVVFVWPQVVLLGSWCCWLAACAVVWPHVLWFDRVCFCWAAGAFIGLHVLLLDASCFCLAAGAFVWPLTF